MFVECCDADDGDGDVAEIFHVLLLMFHEIFAKDLLLEKQQHQFPVVHEHYYHLNLHKHHKDLKKNSIE